MTKPYEFQNTKELINNLKKQKGWLSKWSEKREDSVEEIVKSSVMGNTFRAFRNMPRKPSDVYRKWALERLNDKKTINRFTGLYPQQEYDRWLEEFSNSFRHYWIKEMGRRNPIPYGPGRKLPNLLLKKLVLWNQIVDSRRKQLIKQLHVPLDQYTLVAIRNCIRDFPEAKTIGSVPRNASMSFVNTKQRYTAIQSVIRRIAKQAGVPPIYVDVLAWDKNHERQLEEM